MMVTTRAGRRLWNLAGVVAVIGLMSYALYAQYVQHYEACPLCIFQRVAVIGLGLVFLIAALHAPRGAGARVYAVLGLLVALAGMGISGGHLYLQHLPPDAVPACGPGLDYLWDTFPVAEVIQQVFTGSGECAEVNWSLLGLSMPGWVLIWFVILGALAVFANWHRVGR
jgi:protein dithiol:quinone oxidoreductase